LVDEEGAITEKYGARKTPEGGVLRSVYIVDKQGIIRFAQRGTPPDEELLRTLEGLRG
jgi:alkyl hydroperoxide reductase subunit AhpC